MCVVKHRSLRRADYSSLGVLPSVVLLNVIVKPRHWGGSGPLGGCRIIKKKKCRIVPRKDVWGTGAIDPLIFKLESGCNGCFLLLPDR